MGKNYFEIYREVWNFHKAHSQVSEDTQYWDSVVDGLCQLSTKYDRDPFVVGLCLVVLDELERIHKELKNHKEV